MNLPGWQWSVMVAATSCAAATATAERYYSENFIVEAPTRALAAGLAERAESQRSHVSQEIFGGEFGRQSRRTLVRARLANGDCQAATQLLPAGGGHVIDLRGPLEEVAGRSLDHEVFHATLADAAGVNFPDWLNEGLACRYDNNRLKGIRQRIVRDMLVENTWPDLEELFAGPIRTQKQYSTAESLTAYLLKHYSPQQLIAFGVASMKVGTDAALADKLGIIGGVQELKRLWHRDLHRVAVAKSRLR